MRKTKHLLIITAYLVISLSNCKKTTECYNCRENKRAPKALIGPHQTIHLPVDSVVLDGSKSSDVGGRIVQWNWSHISGPTAFEIVSQHDSVTVVRKLELGFYTFQLKVSDEEGYWGTDSIHVLVLGPNRAPVANAGNDQTYKLIDTTLILDGSNSFDPDGDVLTYRWNQVSGPLRATVSDSGSALFKGFTKMLGTYEFELTVTDSYGLSDKDTVQVILVEPCKALPGGTSQYIRITLPFDSVWVDYPNGTGKDYCWTKISGPESYQFHDPYSESKGISKLTQGIYTFLKVPLSYTGPADSVFVEVVEDAMEKNTVEYRDLRWNHYPASNFGDIMMLRKPWWFNNSADLKTEILLQIDGVNGGKWFNVPSSQSGIEFSIKCYDNCLTGLTITTSDQNKAMLQGKPTGLKVRVL